jgi:hypothetical protein
MLGTRMIDDPSHWRQRAQEARAEADKLGDASMKQTMLEIAASYERLAEIAERRTTAKRA